MQEYINVDQRIHLLCQILAKVTANFVPEAADYSHTNLAFDPIGKRIHCRWINGEKGRIALSLDHTEFSLQWISDGLVILKTISISGKTLNQLEHEIQSSLLKVGNNSAELPIELKYKIEEYPFKDTPFNPLDKNILDLWIYHRTLANEACDGLLRLLNVEEEVRIWPHHFDTGVYSEIGSELGVGFGLAVKDSLVNSPYFYLSGYPLKEYQSMDNLPKLKFGNWKTGEWKGAVLPLSELDNMKKEKMADAINDFVTSSFSWYQNAYF